MKRFSIYILMALIVSGLSFACTDLNETLYSEVGEDDYFQTEEEVISGIASVYANMRGFVNDTWQLGTHSTDETLTPEKALGHWFGEDWPLINSHRWTSQHVRFNNAWNFNFTLVNTANRVLHQLEGAENMEPDVQSTFVAELKMIRGWAYYNLIDLFGNVPLVTNWVIEDDSPPTTPREEVFQAIVDDIESNVELLSDNVDGSTYGRFNKYTGYALLAKFYLNAEVWTGAPQWDKVIEYCNKIINSGNYSLTTNYFDNFLINNEDSDGNIFVIPYDEINAAGNTIHMRALHYAQSEQFGLEAIPWNGFTAVPSFIHSFDPDDKRLEGWLWGQQFSASGDTLYANQESSGQPLHLTIEYENIFDPEDNTTYNAGYALEFMGARFAKYEYGGYGSAADNDFVIYRYADILLMKAEALMRQNGGVVTDEALNLVNSLRERVFDDPAKLYTSNSSLTFDELLAERGWELYGEGYRRNDLIRFGEFINGTWEFYDRSWETEDYNLFPIPQNQLNSNPNLVQNPGY